MPSQSVVVTSTHKNSTVHLWNLPLPVASYTPQPQCQQSISFTSQKEFLGHLVFDPTGSFLFLASVNMCVGFIIHLDSANKDRDNRAHTTKFDYLTEFEVTQPILSFTVGLQATPQATTSGNEEVEKSERELVMQLFCVQTKAIQIHQTSSEHCFSPSKLTLEEDINGPLTQIGKLSEYDNDPLRSQPLSASAERMAQYNQHQQNKWLAHSVETSRRNDYPPEEQYQDPLMSPLNTAPASPFVAPSDQPTKPETDSVVHPDMHLESQTKQIQQEQTPPAPEKAEQANNQPEHLLEHEQQPHESRDQPNQQHIQEPTREDELLQPREEQSLEKKPEEQSQKLPQEQPREQAYQTNERLHDQPSQDSNTFDVHEPLLDNDNKSKQASQEATQERNAAQSNQHNSKSVKVRGNRGKKDNADSPVSETASRLSPQPQQQQVPHPHKQKSVSPAPVAILSRNVNTTSPQKEVAPRTTSPVPAAIATSLDDTRRFEANMLAKMEKLFVQQLDKQYARLDKERQERERLEKERQEKLLAAQVERVVRKELHTALEKLSKDIVQSVESLLQRTLQDTAKKSVLGVPKPDTLFKDALDKSLPHMSTMLSEALRQPIQQSFVQYFQDKLIPSFDQSCKVMFNQLNSTFEHGVQDVLTAQKAAYAAPNTTSSPTTDNNVLAEQLKVTVQTLLDVTSSMSSNIVETQNKLLASHQATPPSSHPHYQPPIQAGQTHQPLHSTPPPVTHLMHGAPYHNQQPNPSHLPAPPPDTSASNMHATLVRLISQRRFNEAFDMALSASNLPLVAWLCRMVVDPQVIFVTPMSQPVLVSLVQQLAYDLDSETALKFKWLQEVIPYVDARGMSNEPGQVRDIMLHLHAKLEENYAKYVNTSAHSVPFKLLYQTVCKKISTQ